MVARNDIVWAEFGPPVGRRPVCVLTRTPAIDVLTSITCAPISRTIRGIASEVEVGASEGLPVDCAIACDSVVTLAKTVLDPEPVGRLGLVKRAQLDAALRYALDISW